MAFVFAGFLLSSCAKPEKEAEAAKKVEELGLVSL